MRIIVETPYGTIESLPQEDVSIEKTQKSLELIAKDMGYLTILTQDGPVILPSECAKRSLIRIIE